MSGRGRALLVQPGIEIPAAELALEFARSGGPGGQNVNKVESKVVLRFSVARSRSLDPGTRALLLERLAGRLTKESELLVRCSRHRERSRNEADARERMAEILRQALRPRVKRKKSRVPRRAREERLAAKRRRSRRKRERTGESEE